MKKNNKGFTLVELIVVLVILAILAAILVPALLGYIDKARQAQYEEEAHAILVAAQAYETEQYAKGAGGAFEDSIADMKSYIDPIVDPTSVTSGTVVPLDTTTHGAFTVKDITDLKFVSQKGVTVTCQIQNGSITIDSVQ